MPRQLPSNSRHVMKRGLTRRDVFLDDKGRENFAPTRYNTTLSTQRPDSEVSPVRLSCRLSRSRVA